MAFKILQLRQNNLKNAAGMPIAYSLSEIET